MHYILHIQLPKNSLTFFIKIIRYYKYRYILQQIIKKTFHWWEYLTYKFSVRRLRCHCNSCAGLVVENARLGMDKSQSQLESWKLRRRWCTPPNSTEKKKKDWSPVKLWRLNLWHRFLLYLNNTIMASDFEVKEKKEMETK